MMKRVEHRLYLGVRGFMLKIPPLLSERGSRCGEWKARKNASRLTEEERRVHHHIVLKMLRAQGPFAAPVIADELGIGRARVEAIVDKLESLKTFVYRSDGERIDWAYPLSFEDTGFSLTTTSGERFFAA